MTSSPPFCSVCPPNTGEQPFGNLVAILTWSSHSLMSHSFRGLHLRLHAARRARAATVCRRWAGVLNDARAWQQVDLRDFKMKRYSLSDELHDFKDVALDADRAAVLQRWWRRHAPELRSVALPTRFLLHQVRWCMHDTSSSLQACCPPSKLAVEAMYTCCDPQSQLQVRLHGALTTW